MYQNNGKLSGLCGNYDGNQNNDPSAIQCPGGAIEKRNAVNESECDVNYATLAEAQDICNQMKQSIFSMYYQIVDPQPIVYLITVMVIQKRDKILFVMQWPTILVLVLTMVDSHQIGGESYCKLNNHH